MILCLGLRIKVGLSWRINGWGKKEAQTVPLPAVPSRDQYVRPDGRKMATSIHFDHFISQDGFDGQGPSGSNCQNGGTSSLGFLFIQIYFQSDPLKNKVIWQSLTKKKPFCHMEREKKEIQKKRLEGFSEEEVTERTMKAQRWERRETDSGGKRESEWSPSEYLDGEREKKSERQPEQSVWWGSRGVWHTHTHTHTHTPCW